MKKMQVLAMMALLSVGLMNLGAAAVTELLSEYQDLFSKPQTLLFGYGEGKTASVTLTLSDTSFNSFSSAVHNAIHQAENIMNSFKGQQIQFLTSGTPENQVILAPLNLMEFLFIASYNYASNNPGWKAGDPVFYVRVVSSSSADSSGSAVVPAEQAAKQAAADSSGSEVVAEEAEQAASEAVGVPAEQAADESQTTAVSTAVSTAAAVTAEQVAEQVEQANS